jgi:hypothetical protein
VDRKALIRDQVSKFPKKDVLFGADLRDLTLNPDVAEAGNPVLEGVGEIGY